MNTYASHLFKQHRSFGACTILLKKVLVYSPNTYICSLVPERGIVFLQKIKELTYLHSEGILSGELKHGPLAMIDKQMPVIMIIMKDNVYTVSFPMSFCNFYMFS